ncbi:LysB family phage lysis regulatory protein [Billgrantia pellis]|uniref:LysB family phage lysis regulatory protein n=1 Tax=Billgrantia pellis TaxID=2606936 RepID=A0A7V7G1D9_9GAMM|nr:Rz-like lysis system protein LysB [Halomonas pellis]KAA0011199.1 LysB family phage lysis regulatory protein [Halomonas pellis]
MTRLYAALLVFVLVVLVTWALWQRSEAAEARAELAEQQLAEALQRVHESQLVIDALWNNAARLDAQRRATAEQKAELERTASTRLARLQELQHENTQLREWADARLPDAVVRLRKRPAVTGADAYRQSLRDTDALHAAGEFADH